jgi:CDP-glycerol glycerophosphotransferase
VLTSKYYISNVQVEPIFPFRETQIVINTWHGGGAYKRVGFETPVYNKRRRYMKELVKIRARHTSYIIASCEKFKTFMAKDWSISQDKFLEIGMPRNDVFFKSVSLKEKIRIRFNINAHCNIVLYAPTYRSLPSSPDPFNFSLDCEELLKTLKRKFNRDFVLLFRAHINFNNSLNIDSDKLINVSNYPDMQDLLYAADILINDYSSSMWDFSLTYKPCFIFAPDLREYSKTQGFYTPINEWPFPIAETNEQLVNNILDFDETKYNNAIKKHHLDLGSYENGTASEQLFKIVFGRT